MGNLMATPDTSAQERSDEIDRQIEGDGMRFRRECKILVLGTSGSGKTTIIKHIMLAHGNASGLDESSMFVSTVHRNVFDSAYHLVKYLKKTGQECADDWSRSLAEKIYTHVLPTPASDDSPILAPEIVQAIHRLWMDPIIRKVIDEHRSNIYLMDSASYFFDEVLRIGAPGYLPNETDILRARINPRGIKETRINMGLLPIILLEVNKQRGERKKWIHCFEGVTNIMYCVGLDHYNQVLWKDKTQNRMKESLVLFESVVNTRWFLRTNVILLLNRVDVFKTTLRKDPLELYFPEYTGGKDVNKAAKYILWKFMQVNRARLSVYPHLVQATDSSNLLLVFAAVKETILQNSYKNSGIL